MFYLVEMVLGVVGSAGIWLEGNLFLTGGKDEHGTLRSENKLACPLL